MNSQTEIKVRHLKPMSTVFIDDVTKQLFINDPEKSDTYYEILSVKKSSDQFVIDYDEKPKSRTFVKFLQDKMKLILNSQLTMSAYALLFYIMFTINYQNVFYYKRGTIAEELGLSCKSVTQALHQLIKIGICSLIPNSRDVAYLVNPDICYCGTMEHYTVIKKWFVQLEQQNSINLNDEVLKQQQSEKQSFHWKTSDKILQSIIKKSHSYGYNVKQSIIDYLCSNVKENRVTKSASEILRDLSISKDGFHSFINELIKLQYVSRPKRGVLEIHPRLFKFATQ